MKTFKLTILLTIVTLNTILFAGANQMKGKVVTANTPQFKIHSYIGYSGDVSNIIELDKELILIDGQPTFSATKELESVIKDLNKPVKSMIVASHGIGINNFDKLLIAGSAEMEKFIASGSAQVFIDAFSQRFGEDMIKEILEMKPVLKEGKNTLSGLDVKVKTHADDFPPCSDLYFDDGKVIFTHLAANNTHLLMSNPAKLPELVEFWEKAQDADYVMSSHLQVIEKPGIEFTLKYVEKAQEVYKEAQSKEEFMAKMTKAFPSAGMDFFLAMTADNFYKQN